MRRLLILIVIRCGEPETGDYDYDYDCKNSICAIHNCSYVGSMNWQQFLALAGILTVAVVFVWRSSGQKKHEHNCGCGCAHEHGSKKEETAAP